MIRKIVILLSVIFVMTLAFLSCSSSDGALDEYKQMLESMSDENVHDRFADKVYVIISKSCSGELSLKAKDLADAISSKTGVDAIVKYDNEQIVFGERDMALLLGDTCELASQEALKPLKYDDYICKWDGNSIVLGGREEAATIKSVDRFMTEILHGASSKSLMSKDAGFEKINTYAFSSVTLNGFDLYDYTLVYPDKNEGGEKEYVEVFRKYIVNKSGYLLNVISDKEIDDTTGKIISFEKNPKTSGALLDAINGNFYIKAADDYELSVITADLAESLFKDADSGKAVAWLDSHEYRCFSRKLKICRSFTSCGDEIDLDFIATLTQMMQQTDNDIIIFEKIKPWLADYIEREGKDYKFISVTDKSGSCYFVLYKDEIFEKCSLDICDEALVLTVKVMDEHEERRVICSLVSESSKIEDMIKASYNYDVLLFDSDLPEDIFECGMSLIDEKAWTLNGEEYRQMLIAKDALDIEKNSLALDIGEINNCSNVFLSFRYQVDACERFENLKNSLN